MAESANLTYSTATLAVQSGLNTDTSFQSVVPPLYMASNYRFDDLDNRPTYEYGRSGNPTRDLLATALTELEGGQGTVVTSSGMAAVNLVLQLLTKDDLLVAPKDSYGGTYRLFESLAKRGAFKLQWLDYQAPNLEHVLLELAPDFIWIESPSNPLLRVTDIKHIAQVARQVGAKVVVDNTFLSPVGQQPIALGADIVVHSSTKYLNGHSDVVSGAVICAHEDDHEAIAWWANNTGVTGSPFDSYLILRGVRTLGIRIKQHSVNALAIAETLESHELIKQVNFPGLASHPDHRVASQQHNYHAGMVSFELEGGSEQVNAFLSQLRLFTLAESLGGTESLVCHPATMTHAAMDEEAQKAAGLTKQLIRLSVGIEDKSDLIADILQALVAVRRSLDGADSPSFSSTKPITAVLEESVESAACRLSPALAALW